MLTSSVLDKGFVELQSVMPAFDPVVEGERVHRGQLTSADLAVVNAARVSRLGASVSTESDKRLIQYLASHRHTTPFEHVVFTFRVKAPVIVWWQWIRHRWASYNLQSGRYTAYEENDWYIPIEWRKQSLSNKQASTGVLPHDQSAMLTESLIGLYDQAYALYKKALDMGVAREQARLFLPAFGVYYIGYVTANLWSMLNFIRLRDSDNAQAEIQQYAVAIGSLIKRVAPVSYAAWLESEPSTEGNDGIPKQMQSDLAHGE